MEGITYKEFIQNILDTRGRFECGDEYHERHHITPRCMGGEDEDENLIDLFAKEHFIAHKLLAEENPDNDKLVYAWGLMAFAKSETQCRYELSPEEYEEIKIALSDARKGRYAGEQNPMYGVRRYGSDNPNYGNHYSEDARKKISRAASNRSEETRKKISETMKEKYSNQPNPMYGRTHSDESRKKMSESAKERCTEEWRRNMSERKKRLFENSENHPMYGKTTSEETKEKISNKLKERFKNIENHPNYGTGRIVIQLTLNGEVVCEYKNASDAERHTNINNASIWRCCVGKQKTAGGFRWIYKENLEEIQIAKNTDGQN